jgi:hypothetical protein
VPYRGGGPAIQDLAAGNLNTVFVTVASAAPQLMSGQIRGAGRDGDQRMRSHPDIPTFREQGIDLVAEHWWGLLAPARNAGAGHRKDRGRDAGRAGAARDGPRLEALAVIAKPTVPGRSANASAQTSRATGRSREAAASPRSNAGRDRRGAPRRGVRNLSGKAAPSRAACLG